MHGGAQWPHARRRAVGREMCAAEMRERLERVVQACRSATERCKGESTAHTDSIRRPFTPLCADDSAPTPNRPPAAWLHLRWRCLVTGAVLDMHALRDNRMYS